MKNKIIKLATLAVVSLALGQTLHATEITGGISFGGSVTPYVTGDGSGPASLDYTGVGSLTLSSVVTVGTATGSFHSILAGTSVGPVSQTLELNPLNLPSSALWSVGGFTFMLTSLAVTQNLGNSLSLSGVGIISDGSSSDDTTGTWLATFNAAGGSFSWSSSSAALVPDGGTTVLLLGGALSGLALMKRKMTA